MVKRLQVGLVSLVPNDLHNIIACSKVLWEMIGHYNSALRLEFDCSSCLHILDEEVVN
jgi:hypothetical protein